MPSRRSFLRNLSILSCALPGTRLLAFRPGSLGDGEAGVGWPSTDMNGAQATGASGTWRSKIAPLMTQWATKVDPEAVLPDYPRPQMVRRDWLNLNGLWEFRKGGSAGEAVPAGQTLDQRILVPFPMESALSGVMEHADRCWYRRVLTVPAGWRGKQILLHFGAVDWESEVFVNGKSVGVHRGGYDPFSYDITTFLKGDGPQELIVRVFDPTEAGGQPRGKQDTTPGGITYTPTTGIWQTVWLEPVAASHIEGFRIVPDIDRQQVALTVDTAGARADKVVVTVRQGKTVIRSASASPGETLQIPVPNPRLWSPEDPFLYDLDIVLERGGGSVDAVASYVGMKKIALGDVQGQKRIFFNNKPLFLSGPLDQGFWPDGIYTAPTDEALKSDIVRMKEMGFNFVRKHIKVEPARWYYWADKLGLLVWQDMPSGNSYIGRKIAPPINKAAYEIELKRMVETLRNVPSIFLWCTFNEGQGQFDTEKQVNTVRALDPSRLINEASGGNIEGFGDIDDIHVYPDPEVRPPNGRQATVLGEYGGVGYIVPDHSWDHSGKNHSYTVVQTKEDLVDLYAQFMATNKELRDRHNMSAFVYTELTDVEIEINGLLTYDRLYKVRPDVIRTINAFDYKLPGYRDIVPTSKSAPQEWRYTFSNQAGSWADKSFDDSGWKRGNGPFGNGGHAGTSWTSTEIWLRRHFNPGDLTPADVDRIAVSVGSRLWSKEDSKRSIIEIFINGILAYRQKRVTDGYSYRPIQEVARKAIVANGDNIVAVHVLKVADGDQFIDAGLAIRRASAAK